MSEQPTRREFLSYTAQIVSAHLSHNTLPVTELPNLIQQVYQTLALAGSDGANSALTRPKPAVPINKSVTDEYIICLEDGKKLQMLKRYLKTAYNMTVDEYRERWGLGADYPVVAPNYALRRSQIAKSTGLGMNGRRGRLSILKSEEADKLSQVG